MEKSTYDMSLVNTHIEKVILAGGQMLDAEYDAIEIRRKGMKIRLEFPPKSARDQLIEQEVKAIITGELQEKSRRYIS